VAFDNPDFGRKNYEEYLRGARETLRVKHLTDDDRRIIERGIYYLIRGDDLFKREDPESLREAASLFLTGGYYLGGRCLVSESEKEYWRRRNCAKGGAAEKESSRQKRAWEVYVFDQVTKKPEIPAATMTENLILDKAAPRSMPKSFEYLIKTVRRLKKQIKGDKRPLKLVHSA
jgi:hypothetical protein